MAVLHTGVSVALSVSLDVLPASTVDVGTFYQPVSSVSLSISSTTHVVRSGLKTHCVDPDPVDLKDEHVYLNVGVLKTL